MGLANIGTVLKVVIIVTFLTWIVYLGGLASLQDACNNCTWYRFWWWVWAYELALIIALAFVSFKGMLATWKMSLLALYAVAFVLFMLAADTFTPQSNNGNNGNGNSRQSATAAGAIMTAIMNGVIVILLGMSENNDASDVKVLPA